MKDRDFTFVDGMALAQGIVLLFFSSIAVVDCNTNERSRGCRSGCEGEDYAWWSDAEKRCVCAVDQMTIDNENFKAEKQREEDIKTLSDELEKKTKLYESDINILEEQRDECRYELKSCTPYAERCLLTKGCRRGWND